MEIYYKNRRTFTNLSILLRESLFLVKIVTNISHTYTYIYISNKNINTLLKYYQIFST